MRLFSTLLGSALIAAVALAPAPAAAVTVTEIEFTDTTCSEGIPDQVIQLGDVLILIGQVNIGKVEGDIEGYITVDGNVILGTATGTGIIFGTFRIDTDDGISWEGPFEGSISNFFATGSFVGIGNDGSLIVGEFEQTGADPPKFNDTATIFSF